MSKDKPSPSIGRIPGFSLSRRPQADDLLVGIAAALDEFNLRERLDEGALAEALQAVADDTENLGHRMLLRAVTTALADPRALSQLRLKAQGRGRPKSRSSTERSLMIGNYVARLLAEDWPNEAAVAKAAEMFCPSRATIMRALRDKREFDGLVAAIGAGKSE